MILFHDVDGCLNDEDGAPLGYETGALTAAQQRKLAELGARLEQSDVAHMVLNTGRCLADCGYLLDALGTAKARYALVEHGAVLWDAHEARALDLGAIAHSAGRPDLAVRFQSVARMTPLIRWYDEVGAIALHGALDLPAGSPVLPRPPSKIANLTLSVPEDVDGELALLRLQEVIAATAAFGSDDFTYHYGVSDRFIDVTAQVDKGVGVELVCAHLGHLPERAAAIGNGLNDLPMLSVVGLPICPANAEPEVRKFCGDQGGVVAEAAFIGASFHVLEAHF